MPPVLDSSAVLAWLQQEPGAEAVAKLLDGGIVSAANWAEILQKATQHGGDPEEVGLLLRSLGVEIEDVTRPDGETAADLWVREAPLSLGDRLCIAIATRLSLPAYTADARWTGVSAGVDIQLIR